MQDQLKSSSAFVTQGGVVTSRNYFFPFGGNRGGTAFSELSTKRFTGQYHEASLPGGEGLSYYGARWYDAQLGRFVSPDSLIPDPNNPQDFNRFSYVRNNPLTWNDPSGHEPCPGGSWSNCLPPSPKNTRLASGPLYRLQAQYYQQGVSWGDLPGEVRAYLRSHGITPGLYADCCGNAKAQTGWKDPATIAASVVGGWRLGSAVLPKVLVWLSRVTGIACGDGDCGNEISTLQRAVDQGIQSIRDGIGRGYRSFSSFKYYEGAAGQGYDWHHIVEQTPQNVIRFGGQAIHNTNNINLTKSHWFIQSRCGKNRRMNQR